jgi:hypothetical protein
MARRGAHTQNNGCISISQSTLSIEYQFVWSIFSAGDVLIENTYVYLGKYFERLYGVVFVIQLYESIQVKIVYCFCKNFGIKNYIKN